MEDCGSFSVELKALIDRCYTVGLHHDTRSSLSGQNYTKEINPSLTVYKKAFGLLVEAVALHITMAATNNSKSFSNDTSPVKVNTMKIAEQVARQDEILKQFAWLRAIVSQLPACEHDGTLITDDNLDSITDYASSVCGDSVLDDVAEKMHHLSLRTPPARDHTSDNLIYFLRPSLSLSHDTTDSMTILIGNTHRLVTPQPEHNFSNKHLWSFYLQASGEEIIHEVRTYLHPTFTPPELTLKSSPYNITRVGWGYFIINIIVVLKAGFLWHKNNGRFLELEWELDFGGSGCSASYAFAVTTEKGNVIN